MNKPFAYLGFIVFITAAFSFQAQAGSFSGQPDYSQRYNPARNAYDDGRDALALAAKTGRRVIIEIGGNWCGFCHQLDAFLKRERSLQERFFSAFVLLKVNVSDENSNAEFLSAFTRINGYPHMFVTESSGKVIHSQDPALLRDDKGYSVAKFDQFISAWKIK